VLWSRPSRVVGTPTREYSRLGCRGVVASNFWVPAYMPSRGTGSQSHGFCTGVQPRGIGCVCKIQQMQIIQQQRDQTRTIDSTTRNNSTAFGSNCYKNYSECGNLPQVQHPLQFVPQCEVSRRLDVAAQLTTSVDPLAKRRVALETATNNWTNVHIWPFVLMRMVAWWNTESEKCIAADDKHAVGVVAFKDG
jgi:hypothetical protein